MKSYDNPCDPCDPCDAAEAAGQAPRVKREKTDYTINKVIQALNVLEQFHDDVDELSLTDLSKRLSMNEKSVDLLLATLKSRNYIEQNRSTKSYRLGFKNLELAQTVLRQTYLYRVSHPVLASVALECGETTAVAVLRKSYCIELDAVQSEHPVQVVPRVGVALPVHCTAAGKALIAAEPESVQDLLFEGGELARYTDKTLTSAAGLKQQLRRIVEQGYAVDDQEQDRDVRSVAAVIRDYTGRVAGAVVITGPACRLGHDRLEGELIPLVQRGAREISAKLGFQEPQREAPGLPAFEVELEHPVRRNVQPRTAVRKRKAAGTPCAA